MMAARRILVGALLAAMSCTNEPTARQAETTTPEASSTSIPIASPTAAPSAAPSPSDAAPIGDVSRSVRVLLPSWRPAGPTLIVDRRPGVGNGHVIVAVPLSGGPAVDLVAFPGDSVTWDSRSDGSAIVASVNTYCGSGACDQQAMRLTVIDMRAGVARWLTAADETRSVGNPLWSPDGAFVYYGAAEAGASVDLGIYRISANGTDATRITEPVPPAPAGLPERPISSARPRRVTTDGLLFWSAVAGAKGTLKVRDLATGIDRAFAGDESCLAVVAWRPAPPGALVAHGGCQTPTPKLTLWDLRTGAQTLLIDRSGIGAVYDADWDPAATRIVASVAGPTPEGLAFVDGRGLTPIQDTQGAFAVRWLALGIAYTAFGDQRVTPPPDCPFGISTIRFLPGAAGPPQTLYRGCGIGVWHAVNT